MYNSPMMFLSRQTIFLLAFLAPAFVPRPGEAGPPVDPPHTFTLSGDHFLLDGKPFQIIAGEMHYARIPREYWRHRLRMARAMGLNTVATYVFWNYHEPRQGEFDFTSERRDLAAFIRTAAEEGLWVIIRPGPYACAEWEFGGYPWWLLRDPNLVVRGMDPEFLGAAEKYLARLGREVAPLQVTRGGPVIMVQVENEYGSFGSDRAFMEKMRDYTVAAGFDVPLFTADGPTQCRDGHLPGVLPAINGDVNPVSLRDTVRKYNGGSGPFFCPEFYPGWLDHWGEAHAVVPAGKLIPGLDALLSAGVSVNLYMLHGGTNFGFTSGANYGGRFQPQPTSYDYDAPLDEAGRPTPKYFALREVILRNLPPGARVPEPPPALPVIEIPPVELTETAPLFDGLPGPIISERTLTMEEAGVGAGYILYRTTLSSPAGGRLEIEELRDYGIVFLDGRRIADLDRRHRQKALSIPSGAGDRTLDILVENGGRINYGRQLTDNRKGITGGVTLNGAPLRGWKIYPLPLADIASWDFSGGGAGDLPAFHRGEFSLDRTGDTFLDMSAWGKGCVWVNGHNLGRFWYIGPQQTLYCPGTWLKTGRNEVVVLELGGTSASRAVSSTPAFSVRGLTRPVLDSLRGDALAPPPPSREPGTLVPDSADHVLAGTFSPGDSAQVFHFPVRTARYFCLESLSSLAGDPFASASELYLLDPSGVRLDRAGWTVPWVESEELVAEDGRAENAIDGDRESIWHTGWGSGQPPHPHSLVVDLGEETGVAGFVYLSRTGNAPGKIREFNLYLRSTPFRRK